MVINFYFFLKKNIRQVFLTNIHNKAARPQTSSRPQEQNQQPPQDQRDQLVPYRQIDSHSNHVSSPYSAEVEVQHENAICAYPTSAVNWGWFCSGTHLSTIRWYLSFILASGTYQSIVPTEFRLMLLPLPLQLQSQSQECDSIRANHRRQCKKRRSSWVVWVHRTVLQW